MREEKDGFHTDMPFEKVHGNGGLLTTVADLLKWNENFADPKVGDRAFVGTFDAEVFAIDLRARKIAWRYRDPDREFPYYSSAALDTTSGGSRAVVIIGGRDKAIHAIDAASGKAVWKFVTRARVDSSPAVAGGRVYVGSSDGKLYVLDAATGKKTWEFDAGDAITASPAIAGGRVVVGSQDGRLYCFG